jgi:hypothetical protein
MEQQTSDMSLFGFQVLNIFTTGGHLPALSQFPKLSFQLRIVNFHRQPPIDGMSLSFQ